MKYVKRLLIIASMAVAMTGCSKDVNGEIKSNTSSDGQLVENTKITENGNTEGSGNTGEAGNTEDDGNTGEAGNTEDNGNPGEAGNTGDNGNSSSEEPVVPTDIDFSMYEELDSGNGIYMIKEDIEEQFDVAYPMASCILLCKDYEEEDGDYTNIKVFDPASAKITCERKLDKLRAHNIQTIGDKVIVTIPEKKRMDIYNRSLELEKEYELPVEKCMVIIPSKDLKYCASLVYDEEGLDITTIDMETGAVNTITNLDPQSSATQVVYDNVLSVVCPNVNEKGVIKFYSMKDTSEIDIDDFLYNYNFTSYKDRFFYYLNDASKTGVYFGNRGEDIKCIYGLYNEAEWDYVNNAFINYVKDYDNEKLFFNRYSLEDGRKLNDWNISMDKLFEGGNAECLIVPEYNKLFIFASDYSLDKTRFFMADLDEKEETADELLDVNNAGEINRLEDDGIPDSLYEKAEAIGEKYGVKIYIGSQCRFQSNWGYRADLMLDPETIERNLDILDEKLSVYPENFFERLKYGSINEMIFYLAGSISNDIIGNINSVAAFASGGSSHDYIVFDTSIDATGSTFHEMAHIIDRRLEWCSLQNDSPCMPEWESYNPEDFEWIGAEGYEAGEGNKYVDYTAYENASFVMPYSMVNALEDRATLMEAAMQGGYMFSGAYDLQGQPIMDKLKYYCDTIRENFDTTGWPEILPWETQLRTYGYK